MATEKETTASTAVTVTPPALHSSSHYAAVEYERKLHEALTPLPESKAKTAFYARQFFAGLCNQYMRFMGVAMLAQSDGVDQIIEESISWKDTFGTNTYIHSSKL